MKIENSDKVPTSHVGHIAWLVMAALLGSLLGYVVGVDWQNAKNLEDNVAPVSTKSTLTTTTATDETASTSTSAVATKQYTPVLIYAEEIAQTSDSTTNRSYPTVKVMKKVGASNPEELARVGKVGEYPAAFILSPDHKTLYINLESKIQTLDLSSKKLSDFFTPRKQVYNNFVFSPDGTRMFIWDQIYASTNDFSYFVHDLNISTKKDTIIKSGQSNENIYFPLVWRSDNKVVLGAPKGDASDLWSYDLSSNELKQTTKAYAGVISKDGMLSSTYNKSIDDPCNDYSGSGFSVWDIIEPISGNVVGTAGDASKISTVVAFSSDNKQVLFGTTPVREKSKCDTPSTISYFTKDITAGSTPNAVSDLSAILGSWGASPLTQSVTGGISVDGKTFVTSSNPLFAKDAYYQ